MRGGWRFLRAMLEGKKLVVGLTLAGVLVMTVVGLVVGLVMVSEKRPE